MTIRKRIWIIYIASILLPVFILIGSVSYLINVEQRMNTAVEKVRNEYTHDPIDRLISEIEKEVIRNPEVFSDKSYMDFLKSALDMTPIDLTIYKGDETLIKIDKPIKDNDDVFHVIRQGSFYDDEGAEYTYEAQIKARRISYDKSIIFRIGNDLPKFIVLFIVLFGLFQFLLFKYVLRTVFAPLAQMKASAEKIRDEEYDEPLIYQGNDEVGQVFDAFEEMRLRIKDTDEVQRQYEENRKELIANISHDLKTPITAINGYVQGILDGVANTDEKMKAYIETIAVYGRDMDTLIDDLSLLSKLDLDGVLFQFESVAIVPYIRDGVEELNFDLEEKGIETLLDIRLDDQVKVEIDGGQIKRVLNNIIFNAIKHFDKEKSLLKVTLQMAEDDTFVEVLLEDNGVGIPKDKLANIFDRFYRADASRTSTTGGSGLGLSIAQQIVEAHGGQIWAQSEEGEGTVIGFTLPIDGEV
jgi:signal transduction histidine kinase